MTTTEPTTTTTTQLPQAVSPGVAFEIPMPKKVCLPSNDTLLM